MAESEGACTERGIRLFVLPPHSPRLNGAVERANRTHAEEFHELAWGEPDLRRLGRKLLRWERTYNRIRPHEALGYVASAWVPAGAVSWARFEDRTRGLSAVVER